MTTTTINVMPEPGTPAYDNMLAYMREAYADPRNVRFRKGCREDQAMMAFLTQGDSIPLADVADPIRTATEVTLVLVVTPAAASEDALMDDIEEFMRHRTFGIGRAEVYDIQIEDVHEVLVLDKPYYREGDHFQNPVGADSGNTMRPHDPDKDGCTSRDAEHIARYHA